MKPENKISANNIKALREYERISQKEFGKKYGNISQQKVAAYENGAFAPNMDFSLALAEIYHFPPEWLATVKFKINETGISNLPKYNAELNKTRKEIDTLFKDFEQAVTKFRKGINRLNIRIDKIEKSMK